MNKDPGARQWPSASHQRSTGFRELDAAELATVLGGTNQRRPDRDGDDDRAAPEATRIRRFWRWFFG
jgi:hypothetical protein